MVITQKNEAMKTPTVYTIGHSTHTIEDFIKMLQSFEIKTLVDVRSFPSSRKFPHFNREKLSTSVKEVGIEYIHLLNLGGRRKVHKDSKNTRWHNDSFKSYADYMETDEFEKAVIELMEIATKSKSAYMCAEAVWWRCHRSMISDYLKVKGWKVLHIMAVGKVQEHPYTQPAKIVNGNLSYSDEDEFSEQSLF